MGSRNWKISWYRKKGSLGPWTKGDSAVRKQGGVGAGEKKPREAGNREISSPQRVQEISILHFPNGVLGGAGLGAGRCPSSPLLTWVS